MNFLRILTVWFVLVASAVCIASAQPALQNDFSYSLRIPSVENMESSQAHLYVLSGTEGMAVFRTRPDSLQWLYTAAGMQNRGNMLQADIRFAYLFGKSRRLTVLEPTSVMGAYSSTNLPAQPLDAERLDNMLYVILGNGQLGMLDLDTPETLDTPIQEMDDEAVAGKNFVDIEATIDRLFLLSDNAQLIIYDKSGDTIRYLRTLQLGNDATRLFTINGTLMASNNDGDIYEVNEQGKLSRLGGIEEPVVEMKAWKDWLLIRGSSNRVWSSYQLREPTLWKTDGDAGNYMAVSKEQLWMAEYNRISRITEGTGAAAAQERTSPTNATPRIVPINDWVIPYPQPLLIPIKLEGGVPAAQVQLNLQADVEGPVIRGQSLYWLPQSEDTGIHNFKVVASTRNGQSTSTSFTVDVRSFNAPPRFTPLRTISIPVNQPFNLPVQASDPDGPNQGVMRYMGVNLPQGATLDEQTGNFNWTPTERNLGEHTFRIIATDQYGAAASANITIRVVKPNS